jgi:hypothetical protein
LVDSSRRGIFEVVLTKRIPPAERLNRERCASVA